MSGYILLWKRTLTDPRFKRLVRTLERAWPPGHNLPREFFETLGFGCLARLWIHADDHIRDDDSLELSADEIDELLGIKLVGEILGPNYLQVLDAHNVRLPNYTTHNNLRARKRAFGASRVEKHRSKRANGNAVALQSNATALHGALPPFPSLPIPALPSPALPNPSEGERRAPSARAAPATRLPEGFELTEARRAYATQQGVADASREWAKFCDYWRSASGAKARRHDWDATWRNWCRRASELPGGRPAPKALRTAEEVEADYKARGLPLE